MPKHDTEWFIQKAREVHGDKYDYSKSHYVNYDTKIEIICPKHGSFWQLVGNHLKGKNCPLCTGRVLYTTESFIKKAKEKWGDKFDYSEFEYKGNKIKSCIKTKDGKRFWQTPNNHLAGCDCSLRKVDTKEFINRAKTVHGNKYDYSKVHYKGMNKPISIICPIHGEFQQIPSNHLAGKGCMQCAIIATHSHQRLSMDEFLEKAHAIFGGKYDYSKVNYINNEKKICIICPEHGEFWQSPSSHLQSHGCPICGKHYRKGEYALLDYLKEQFPSEVIVSSFRDKSILKMQELDIYLQNRKIAIEYQGGQHFQPVDFGGYGKEKAETLFLENRQRDIKKQIICKKQGITLLYFSDYQEDYFLGEKIYHNKEELKNAIQEIIKREEEK